MEDLVQNILCEAWESVLRSHAERCKLQGQLSKGVCNMAYNIQINAHQVYLLRTAVGKLVEAKGLDRKALLSNGDINEDNCALCYLESMLVLNGPNPLEPASTGMLNGLCL